jgi:hypothetical protein
MGECDGVGTVVVVESPTPAHVMMLLLLPPTSPPLGPPRGGCAALHESTAHMNLLRG